MDDPLAGAPLPSLHVSEEESWSLDMTDDDDGGGDFRGGCLGGYRREVVAGWDFSSELVVVVVGGGFPAPLPSTPPLTRQAQMTTDGGNDRER